MRERVDWRADETLPDTREVLHLQGIPEGVELPRRVMAIVEDAAEEYLNTADPRGLVEGISHEAFAGVFRGEGRNAPTTPIEAVVPQAGALALFVATVGARVSDRIQALFAKHELALAAMLDSVASAAADRLTTLLATREAARTGGGNGVVRLGYSPGYCGWHVTGQRALFEKLRPEEIGVTLNESCLMSPLKSVSGVLATGPAEIHRFTPAWAFCAECRDKPCLGRMRSLSAAAPTGPITRGVEEA